MTMTITIDVLWLVVGFFIGFLAGGCLFGAISVGEQWNDGFSRGFKAASKLKEGKNEDDMERGTLH